MKLVNTAAADKLNNAIHFPWWMDRWAITGCVLLLWSAALTFTVYLGADVDASMIVLMICLGLVTLMVLLGWRALVQEAQESAVRTTTLLAEALRAEAEFVIISDAQFKLIYASEGLKRYIGDPQLLARGRWEDIMHALGSDDWAIMELQGALAAGKSRREQTQIYNRFGHSHDVSLEVFPLAAPKGVFVTRALLFNEQEASLQLQSVKKILYHFIDALPLPAMLSTPEKKFLHANRAFVDMIGADEYQEFYEETTDVFMDKGQQLATPDEPRRFISIRWRHRGGFNTERPTLSCIMSVDLRMPVVMTVALPPRQNDLAESSDPADIDRAMVEVWLNALEYAPIAIAFLDKQGAVTQSNKSFCALSHKQERHGWNIFDCIAGNYHDALRKEMTHIAKHHPKHPIPVDVAIRGDDTTALLYLSSMGVGHEGFVAHMVDITQQRKIEQRMVQSQKMQAVGQLAGGIAHDFNNLLTAMIGFCDLLLMRHVAGDPSFPDLMQIKQNANRAANLVRQLLAFSRKQTLQPEVVNVTDILADLSHLIHRLIGEHIHLDIVHGQKLGRIKADAVQLEQVIINLAVNARDAMVDGGNLNISTRHVTVNEKHPIDSSLQSASPEDDITPGDYICIEVQDSGQGMSRDVMDKIFDPFFTTKGMGEGTGLGLATVYGIVKQTGGYIYLKSEIGKGTTFSIFLPEIAEEEVATIIQQKVQDDERQGQDLSGVGTILIVEDETPVRMFSVRALKNKGYNVLEAEHGKKGLEVIEAHDGKIDVIVTDVMMPHMDGPTMVNEVRKTHPDMKVVFISGYGEDVFIKNYGEAREFHFLPKPYSLKQLAAKVKDVMDGGK
ncbi:MAG: response regulator [Alphaproteobacteria bacterium]|nr:response regulator [Alphaproteobacteria bacterium]